MRTYLHLKTFKKFKTRHFTPKGHLTNLSHLPLVIFPGRKRDFGFCVLPNQIRQDFPGLLRSGKKSIFRKIRFGPELRKNPPRYGPVARTNPTHLLVKLQTSRHIRRCLCWLYHFLHCSSSRRITTCNTTASTHHS